MSKLPGLKSRGLSLSFLPCSQDAPKCEDGEPALVLGDDDNDGPAIAATYNDLVQGGANSLPSSFTPFEFNVEMFSSQTGEWKELNL
ncbi:hypothetical protein ACFX19_034355 [Malus domestica]